MLMITLTSLNNPDYLFFYQVMDFSASQRSGRAEEYAEVMVSLIPSFASLSPEAQAAERARFLKEAQETLKGCATHFNGSVLRIKRSHGLVPPERADEFQALIYQLMSQDTTSEEFDQVATEIESEFPHIKGWLKWWLRPANASMIFPAKLAMSDEVSQATPNTSNPIEHRFSLLHRAVGTDQDLIPGIKKLYLHVEEMHKRYLAIKGSFIYNLVTSNRWLNHLGLLSQKGILNRSHLEGAHVAYPPKKWMRMMAVPLTRPKH
jgi:hypothetical protein